MFQIAPTLIASLERRGVFACLKPSIYFFVIIILAFIHALLFLLQRMEDNVKMTFSRWFFFSTETFKKLQKMKPDEKRFEHK